uniref:RRM domain-containing protein n=1 Tax=Tanacetum cinerariifolium TaxID=118510 RepID=A0A6L2J5R1_TANCI|nr:hypothetical protein [Tanacetum cinerariifolium]
MAPSGSNFSNVSLLERLSCNIFITNFPPQTFAKDLWKTCQKHGTVLDVYIPDKVSNQGKRFAFARFKKVSDVDLLINNLRSVWMGSFHLYANVARFNRNTKIPSQSSDSYVSSNVAKPSFAKVVKGKEVLLKPDEPVMVLEPGVLNFEGDPALVGCVKDFKTIPNLHNVVEIPDRVVWIDIEGTPLRAWSQTTFNKIASKWGDLVYMEDSSFNKYSMRICVKTKFKHLIAKSFKVILKGKVYVVRAKEVTDWVPDFGMDDKTQSEDASENNSVDIQNWDDTHEDEVIPGSFQNQDYNDTNVEKSTSDEILLNITKLLQMELMETVLDQLENLNDINTLPCRPPQVTNKTVNDQLEESVNKSPEGSKQEHSDFMSGPAKYINGGILCVWDNSLFHKKRTYSTDHCLCVEGLGYPDDVSKRFGLIHDLKVIDQKDSVDLAQKAKVKWAIEGDENSKYFHGIVNKKRRQLAIEAPLEGDFPNRLHIDQSLELECAVSNEEIKKAVWDCGSDKSPSPDGFTFEFFKKFWCIVGDDMSNAIKEFFRSSSFRNGCNPSFIAFIPKDHLDDILDKFGFGSRWRGWIRGCLHSSKASILVNGSPTDEFSFHRGLRQGDHLSPFLFILVMESLHVSFQRIIDRGLFDPIYIGNDNTIPISHLFYADDAMFIGKWTCSNVNAIMMMLHWFFLASGLKMNVHKSRIYGAGVRLSDIRQMDDRFGCIANNLPFTYLGVKVVGGRLTLIKSFLGAIPTYYMSLFKVPEGILSHLERLRNNFFLGADIDDRKITWVCWRKVMTHKNHGGLSVNSLYALNIALMFKWVWRFLSSPLSIWCKVIKAIYGKTSSLDSPIPSRLRSSTWGGILTAINKLKSKGVDLMGLCKLVIGNGNITRFWHDKWYGEARHGVAKARCVTFTSRYRPRHGLKA